MRNFIDAMKFLTEAEDDKTKIKDKTAFDFNLDDGSSKGELSKPAEKKDNGGDQSRKSKDSNRSHLPGGRASKGETRSSITGGDNQDQSLRYLGRLHSSNLEDEISDEEAARNAGEIDTPMLPSSEETKPATPENLPSVINNAVFAPGSDVPSGVTPPKWHMVKNLPGYMASPIRAMGRMVFAPFTDTPIEDIQVLATLINGQDVKVMADWIKRNGQKDDEATIRAEDILPGYQADISIWNSNEYTFMLVKDHAGYYIYGWPGGRGVNLDGPQDFARLENAEEEIDEDKELLDEGSVLKNLGTATALGAALFGATKVGEKVQKEITAPIVKALNSSDSTQKEKVAESFDETADYYAKLAGVRPVPKTTLNETDNQEIIDFAILAGIKK